MRLAIDRLLSDGLRLELPHEGSPPNRLELERGLGVRGVYAHDAETIMLEGLVADELDAATVVWRFGEASRIEAAPLVLGGAEIDLRIARGPLRGRHRLAGSIGARDVQGKAIAVTIGTTAIVGVGLEGSGVSFRTGHGEPTEVKLGRLALVGVAIAAGDVRVEIESLECRGGALRLGEGNDVQGAIATLELKGGRAKIGEVEIAFASATAQDVRLVRSAQGIEIAAGVLEIRGIDLQSAAAKLRIVRAQASQGVRFVRGELSVPDLSVDEASFDVALAKPDAEEAPTSARVARSQPFDLMFLDQLSGRVNVDLNVDVRIPVIKRRVAVHRFRVPIDKGTIDFHELERDLSFLEDAILDFKLKGDRLVFEKDIPLIPFDEETIVYWQLEDDEIRMAQKNLVRLRRLAAVKQPDRPKKKSDEPSGFEIVKLDLEPIEAVLRLDGPARIAYGGVALTLGDAARPGFGELRVAGAVRHRPKQPAQPGELRIDLRELVAACERIAVGTRVLAAESLELAALVDTHVVFEGVRPTVTRGSIRGLQTRGLSLAYT
ncbi:MAG: hypothetical protein HOV80_25195 [Polyangiaceae bacterium]|nr:hypothetical protein [Polyangiaceae bacterium]